ncbi:probable protein phosphatase 2C 35 [Phalaenopsis equestris]|uniref:probable protein phosphatase 2C 35 n=1 Tax=Phalaenopsis equestris TaxID=78828 RepID=UPI0009E2EDAB|nr:probable protein phosphatase 2C 35 [Phalaenopsis equestris]
MGCVQGKCCFRYCRCCCCCCRYPSSTSCSSGRDGGAIAQAGPGLVLSGSPVGIAAVPSHGLCLQYSSLTQRGYYPDSPDRENQDAICIRTNVQGNPNLHFFGVFDGHGQFGAQCANFVRDKLVDILSADTELLDDPVKAYHSAFLAVNTLLHDSEIDDSMSGTTAITVLVSGETLFVANVGDSRAVVGVYEGDRLVAEDLSRDQTPFRKDEYERVRLCGARVLTVDQVEGVKDPGIQSWGDEENDEGDPPRLWMQNAMYPGTAFTRSVGDSTAESIGVIAVPEVLKFKITPLHLFFVIASDGIFEFLSSQAVVDMVGSFKDPRDACSALAAEAYKLWLEQESRTDDITAIVVHIKDLCNPDTGVSNEATQMVMKASVYSEKARAEKFLSAGTEICRPNLENSFEMRSSRDAVAERCPACVVPSSESQCPS